MQDILVGSTGFVGSNLITEHKFDASYHSSDIDNAFGTNPKLLVYSGVPAEMFTANQKPEEDIARIEQAKKNIMQINPKKVVLISTVAVYSNTTNVNELSIMDKSKMTTYGKNRYALECWVETNYENHLIVRLPAIYGIKLKKNFIYDYIHRIPALLKRDKYFELSNKASILNEYYLDRGDGFYRCKDISSREAKSLRMVFNELGFTALNFTDSRSIYQFYPLRRLWEDIEKCMNCGVKKVNLVTPPVSVADAYQMLEGSTFINELDKEPYNYDIRTVHSDMFKRNDGYIMTLEEELHEIKQFVDKALEEE